MKNGSSGLTAGPNEYVRRLLIPSSASSATTVTTLGRSIHAWHQCVLDAQDPCTIMFHMQPHNCQTPCATPLATTPMCHALSNDSHVPHPQQRLPSATPLATTPFCHTLSNDSVLPHPQQQRLPLSCTHIHTVSTSVKFSGMVLAKGPRKAGAWSLISATVMMMDADTAKPPPSLA